MPVKKRTRGIRIPKKKVKIATKSQLSRKNKSYQMVKKKTPYVKSLEDTISAMEVKPKSKYEHKPDPARYANYVKSGTMKTNDKHFDEKIAKTEIILNSISRGMDVAAKPIQGIISLAEKYATKGASFIKNLFSKK